MYLNNAPSNNNLARYYVDKYQPSAGRLFTESLKFGFKTLWYNELNEEQLVDQARSEICNSQEDSNNSKYCRGGIKWFEGMT